MICVAMSGTVSFAIPTKSEGTRNKKIDTIVIDSDAGAADQTVAGVSDIKVLQQKKIKALSVDQEIDQLASLQDRYRENIRVVKVSRAPVAARGKVNTKLITKKVATRVN
jgi:hypothetical protein